MNNNRTRQYAITANHEDGDNGEGIKFTQYQIQNNNTLLLLNVNKQNKQATVTFNLQKDEIEISSANINQNQKEIKIFVIYKPTWNSIPQTIQTDLQSICGIPQWVNIYKTRKYQITANPNMTFKSFIMQEGSKQLTLTVNRNDVTREVPLKVDQDEVFISLAGISQDQKTFYVDILFNPQKDSQPQEIKGDFESLFGAQIFQTIQVPYEMVTLGNNDPNSIMNLYNRPQPQKETFQPICGTQLKEDERRQKEKEKEKEKETFQPICGTQLKEDERRRKEKEKETFRPICGTQLRDDERRRNGQK
jgi:hypothetical protein